jgi:broad specificity phosphatase PhoE
LAKRAQNNSKLDTKKIYLIRHGQTDFNRLGIVQGSGVDSSLNDFGRQQARAFFEDYRDIKFDKIYTSVLKRSIESVQDFIASGIPHEALPGLNEISWGTKEGQSITPEEDEYYHHMLDQWKSGNTAMRIRGGESPEDVVKRLEPAIEYILSKREESTVLICMHGRAIRILLCHVLKRPLNEMDMFKHENLCLYLLNYSGTTFSVEKSNNIDHLRVLS